MCRASTQHKSLYNSESALHICVSTFTDSSNNRLCSAVIHTGRSVYDWTFRPSVQTYVIQRSAVYVNVCMLVCSVQSLSHVQLFVTPWTAAHQASLSITSSWSLLKLMSIESVKSSSQLILSSPSPPAFNPSQHQGLQMNQFFASGSQSIGVSASRSILQMNIQD